MVIHVDDHGNKFIRMVDGTNVPLAEATATITVNTVSHNMIMPIVDALAVERTCAQYWYAKHQEAQTTIADLREQLAAKG